MCSKTTQKHSFHFDKEHKVTQGLQHLKMEKRMNQQIAQGQIPVCDLVDMHPQITPGYLLRIAYIALQHLKSKTLLQMEGRKSRLEKSGRFGVVPFESPCGRQLPQGNRNAMQTIFFDGP